jgi:5-hydroxyisourate hydrolase
VGHLTTHILDITAGLPAAGVRLEVHRWAPLEPPALLTSATTGANGRIADALIGGAAFSTGRYTLTVFIAEYFRGRGVVLPEPPFLEEAVIRIGIAHPDQHYHVPLLIAPWSYSVYRGG